MKKSILYFAALCACAFGFAFAQAGEHDRDRGYYLGGGFAPFVKISNLCSDANTDIRRHDGMTLAVANVAPNVLATVGVTVRMTVDDGVTDIAYSNATYGTVTFNNAAVVEDNSGAGAMDILAVTVSVVNVTPFGAAETGSADVSITAPALSSCDEENVGFRLVAGFQINDNFAIEGGYITAEDYDASGVVTFTGDTATGVERIVGNPAGAVSEDITAVQTAPLSGKAKASIFHFTGVARYPFSRMLAVYGKAGVHQYDFKSSGSASLVGNRLVSYKRESDDLRFLYGAGLEVTYDKSSSMRLDYTRYDGKNNDADVIGITGVWRLGR